MHIPLEESQVSAGVFMTERVRRGPEPSSVRFGRVVVRSGTPRGGDCTFRIEVQATPIEFLGSPVSFGRHCALWVSVFPQVPWDGHGRSVRPCSLSCTDVGQTFYGRRVWRQDPLASHERTKAPSPTMSGQVSCLPSLWLYNLKLVSLPL